MKLIQLLKALIIINVIATANVYAAYSGSVVFRDPTGTVAPDETIEIWLTFTLDANSDPLYFDLSQDHPAGLIEANMPTSGSAWNPDTSQHDQSTFASYDEIYRHTSWYCTGTFIYDGVSCNRETAPYETDYSWDPNLWFETSSLSVQPGESIDVLVAKLAVKDGMTPSGEYIMAGVGFGLGIRGENEDGDEIAADIFRVMTPYCHSLTNCPDTFTRTITSEVPVPAAIWFFGSALISLSVLKQRR